MEWKCQFQLLDPWSTFFNCRLPPKKPPRPQRRQRRTFHRWTDKELKIISYLRLYRNCSWVQIQRTFFSSRSAAAVRLAYTHIPTEERMHHASASLSLTIRPGMTSSPWPWPHQLHRTKVQQRTIVLPDAIIFAQIDLRASSKVVPRVWLVVHGFPISLSHMKLVWSNIRYLIRNPLHHLNRLR